MRNAILIVVLVVVALGLIAAFTYVNRRQRASDELVTKVERERYPVQTLVVRPGTRYLPAGISRPFCPSPFFPLFSKIGGFSFSLSEKKS